MLAVVRARARFLGRRRRGSPHEVLRIRSRSLVCTSQVALATSRAQDAWITLRSATYFRYVAGRSMYAALCSSNVFIVALNH